MAATGCPGNPEATVGMAGLARLFFNIATPTPGSHVDDLVASIRMVRSLDATDPPMSSE